MAEYIDRKALIDRIIKELQDANSMIGDEYSDRDKYIAEGIEQAFDIVRGFPFAADVIPVKSCAGCEWGGGRRHQKCSCCIRNRYLKDCYEGVQNG